MDNRQQTVGILEQRAPAIARAERWPAGLLPRVQLALAGANPWGLDSSASRPAWFEAAADALADVPQTPAEAAALQSLFALTSGGAQAFLEERAGMAGQLGAAVDDVAGDLTDLGDAAKTGLSSPWLYLGGAALAAGAAWLYLRKRR